MIGSSEAFRRANELIDRISAYDAPVLIEGETGTGKELAARAIHYRGNRRNGPFVPVNCGALPDELIENELFGHRRGAFTDARDDHPGVVKLARNGTLFLDEIDALTARGQVVLLRFLQDQHFRPLGGKHEEQADVRIIAATNATLNERATSGQFRLDLLYRIKLLHIELPPLRDRYGDAAVLAEHFIALASARYGRVSKTLAPATLSWFDRYTWPGNIRELENLVYREFLLSDERVLDIRSPRSIERSCNDAAASRFTLNYRHAKARAISDFELRFLTQVIERADGNVSAAARLCGTERRHLGRLLKKHQIIKRPAQ
jgi:DNA-binding NtrC family response regulator